MIGTLIDRAFAGDPQPFMFCEDGDGNPVILELYEEYDQLSWRVYGGANS